ncbi:MAG: hypothetical protein VYB54_12590 [Pseudomonadota bacterium]|nr:hypothetical protein [Pseudomonadota bacterium]
MPQSRHVRPASRAVVVENDGHLNVVLPDDLVQRFGVSSGDTVYLRQTDHGLEISLLSPQEREAIEDNRERMQRYRDHMRVAGGI